MLLILKTLFLFSKSYPRGENSEKLFARFNNQHVIEWFKNKGIELVSEEDGRMFPKSNLPKLLMICLFLNPKN